MVERIGISLRLSFPNVGTFWWQTIWHWNVMNFSSHELWGLFPCFGCQACIFFFSLYFSFVTVLKETKAVLPILEYSFLSCKAAALQGLALMSSVLCSFLRMSSMIMHESQCTIVVYSFVFPTRLCLIRPVSLLILSHYCFLSA